MPKVTKKMWRTQVRAMKILSKGIESTLEISMDDVNRPNDYRFNDTLEYLGNMEIIIRNLRYYTQELEKQVAK